MDQVALLEFMKRHRMAVEASVSTGGAPQAAMVAIVVGDGLEILFDTTRTSRKVENLRRNPNVALVIGGWTPGDKRSVQYEGIADEPSGADLDRLKRVYFRRVPGRDVPESWPDLTYVRVRPRWIRFGDFGQTPPEVIEFVAEDLASECSRGTFEGATLARE
jgi:hypothetical protein